MHSSEAFVLPTRPLCRISQIRLPLGAAISGFVCFGLAGCTQNPYMGNSASWQPPQAAAAPFDAQIAELQRRNQLLDNDNRLLQTQIAQKEQRLQVSQEELALMRDQLADATQQLQESRLAESQSQKQFQGLKASTQFRGGATVRANTNLKSMVERLNVGNLPVRYTDDVIRITIPADQLFQPGTAQLQSQAAGILVPVADAIRAHLPRQRVGIEGYTDDRPLYGGQFTNGHQLAAAQTLGVMEILSRRGELPAEQLFTMAMGPSGGGQDQATPAERAASRRIEIAIYPETY